MWAECSRCYPVYAACSLASSTSLALEQDVDAALSKPKQQRRLFFKAPWASTVRSAVDLVLGQQVDACTEQWQTSEDMMRSAPLKQAFAEHVQSCLCYESFKFLVDCMDYTSAEWASVPAQHKGFERILLNYICINSLWEVRGVSARACRRTAPLSLWLLDCVHVVGAALRAYLTLSFAPILWRMCVCAGQHITRNA